MFKNLHFIKDDFLSFCWVFFFHCTHYSFNRHRFILFLLTANNAGITFDLFCHFIVVAIGEFFLSITFFFLFYTWACHSKNYILKKNGWRFDGWEIEYEINQYRLISIYWIEFPTRRLRLYPCQFCGRQFNSESLVRIWKFWEINKF